MSNPVLIPQPFAANGNKNSIQNTRQAGQDPEDATWSDGFPAVTMQPVESGGLPPKGMDFNGIFNMLSQAVVYLQKGGRYRFDAQFAATIGGYPLGSIIMSDDGTVEYRSTVDANTNNPNNNTTGWEVYHTATSPVTGYYDTGKRYHPGEIVFIDGNYYECYHPDGCLGKDPRDAVNRPAGWTVTDETQPYYWIKLGRWLSLPEVGSPIYLPSTSLREGLIKYRNDGTLHKSKFWRLAQLYPNLIRGNYLQIADLRGEFLRGLDDGRGIDLNRVINSAQLDAIENIVGQFQIQGFDGSIAQAATGPFYVEQVGLSAAAGTHYGAFRGRFDTSRSNRTADETRSRNIAMLAATRI